MAIAASNKINIYPSAIGLVLISCVGVLFAANPAYMFCCLVTFIILIGLLWRNASPGILLFSMLVQSAQVFAYVPWMHAGGSDINQTTNHGRIAGIFSCLVLLV